MIAIISSILSLSNIVSYKFSNAAELSNEEKFFGKWNLQTNSWEVYGKLKYHYSIELGQVENHVKIGDYGQAKALLFNYFNKRENDNLYTVSDSSLNANNADLLCDDIFNMGSVEIYLDTFNVYSDWADITVDVTERVINSYNIDKKIIFLLIGRDKEGGLAEFAGKDLVLNAPNLSIEDENGVAYMLSPIGDKTVAGGVYTVSDFDSGDSLFVSDTGAPVDSNSRRSLIKFDLSSISGLPSSARLELHGRTNSEDGEQRIMLMQYNKEVDVELLTFSAMRSMIFSWNGINGGTDWTSPIGSDVEFRANLNRFNFIPTLIAQHNADPEGQYDIHAIRIVRDFLGERGANWPRNLDSALRVHNLITAFENLRGSQNMDAQACFEMLHSLYEHGEFLYDNKNFDYKTNWGITETLGLLKVASYLPELVESVFWNDSINTRTQISFDYLLNEDGSFREPSTHYAGVSLKDMDFIRTGVLALGKPVPQAYIDNMLPFAKYFVDSCFPNDQQTLWGNSDDTQRRSTVRSIGNYFDDPILKYYGATTKPDVAPGVESILYPQGGVAILRNSMKSDALYMHINNRNKGNHGHPDALGIIAYAFDRPLLIDPGRGDYSTQNWLTARTQSHNTIEIDGIAQNRKLDAGESYLSKGVDFDLYEGTTLENQYTDSDGITYRFTHKRKVAFIDSRFWIVTDYLQPDDDTSHKYEQTWHFLPEANPVLDADKKSVYTGFATGANLHIVPTNNNLTSATLEDGYYSPKYGVVNSAIYSSYVKESPGDVNFETLLYPAREGEALNPSINRLEAQASSNEVVALEIKKDTNSYPAYYYVCDEQGLGFQTLAADNYSTDAKMAYIETGALESNSSLRLLRASNFKKNSKAIIESSEIIPDISVTWNEGVIYVESKAIESGEVLPERLSIEGVFVSNVILNGVEVPFLYDLNNLVTINCRRPSISVENGVVKAEYGYRRLTLEDPPNPLMIMPIYTRKNGIIKLIDILTSSMQNEDIPVGGEHFLQIEKDLDDYNFNLLKVFIWNNITDITPIADSLTYEPTPILDDE